MAQFSLDHLLAHRVSNVVLNVHHCSEVAKKLADKLELSPGARLVVSDESRMLLGSAGGIRQALDRLDGDRFFIVNGDSVSDIDLDALEVAHERNRQKFGAELTLALIQPKSGQASPYREIKVDLDSGQISELGELAEGKPYYSGVAVVEKSAVIGLPLGESADFVAQVLRPAVKRKVAGFSIAQSFWIDIGSPLLWMSAHFELQSLFEKEQLATFLSKRIGESITVHSSGVGSVKGSHLSRKVAQNWSGPCFWGGGGEAPRNFGPHGVSYNDAAHSASRGIGFDGHWFKPD